MPKKKENIVVLSAHSDDFVLGAGGTIAKYVHEGKKVFCIVFSYGEKSHLWLKKKIIKQVRAEEAFKASKLLQCKTIFFDLEEGKFQADYQQQQKEQELLKIIEELRPVKIFTHSGEDLHYDHRAVHTITLELYNNIAFKPKPELYIYSIWNPVSFKTRYPAMYVDISKTFSKKMEAIREYPSQKVHIALLTYFLIPYRAVKDGLHIRKPFGEHFFRIR